MRRIRIIVAIAAFLALFFGSVLVFQAFDRTSHSASDTLRPFIITMLPVWCIALIAGWLWLSAAPPQTPPQH